MKVKFLPQLKSALLLPMLFLLLMAQSMVGMGQTVSSDLPDYAPGTIAIITGTGFNAGEDILIHVDHFFDYFGHEDEHYTIQAADNPDGNFVFYYEVGLDEAYDQFILTASQASGKVASTSFTDAPQCTTVSILEGIEGQSVNVKDNVSFNVVASASSPTNLSYLWEYNGGDATPVVTGGWHPITGETTNTLTVTDVTAAMNNYQYRVTVTNSGDGTCNTRKATSGPVTLTVISCTAPIIACPADFAIGTNSGCSYVGSIGTATYENGCGTVTVLAKVGGSTITPSTYEFPKGQTNVVWSATDENGTTSTCTQLVTVSDDDVPVTPTLADVTAQCSSTPTVPTTTDNCAGTLTGTTSTEFPITVQGTTIVTWTFDDGNGNSVTANQNVIIEDVTVPVADVSSLPDATGECSVTVSTPTASDNCAGTIEGTTTDPLTYTQQGTYTITWSYDDGNGNISRQMQTVIVDDVTPPTWSTPDGNLNRSVSCGNARTLAAAQALEPIASDNCSSRIILNKTPGSLIGNTITNTWTADDGNGNISEVFTQVITITAVTIDASASSLPVSNSEPVTLSAQVAPAEGGIAVTFTLDNGNGGGTFGPYGAITNGDGIATVLIGMMPVEVYEVTAVAGLGCATSVAYLAVYDPNGGFVTGGGWITSPAGAYLPNTSLTGKANFGFVSKYKKGSNIPEGNTQFQFQTGNLNFSSSTYSAGSLVVAGSQAIYKGVGTINGAGSYNFMVSAVDGQINGGGGADKFRIKIWNSAGTVYDNNVNLADNATASTILGGGSIVIHDATNNKKVASITPEVGVAEPTLKAYPNPFTESLNIEFSSETDTQGTLEIFSMTGAKLQTLYNGPITGGQLYSFEYLPRLVSSQMVLYRLTMNGKTHVGKVNYNERR